MSSKLTYLFKPIFGYIGIHIALWALVPATILFLFEWVLTGQLMPTSLLIVWSLSFGGLIWADILFPKGMGDTAWTVIGFTAVILVFILNLMAYRLQWSDDRILILMLIAIYTLFLSSETYLSHNKPRVQQWIIRVLFATTSAVLTVLAAQIEIGFADEEFYAALQTAVLAVWYVVLSLCRKYKTRGYPIIGKAISVHKPLIWILLAVTTGLSSAVGIRKYQESFYAKTPLVFTGISPETPFLCGEIPSGDTRYSGEEVYHQLLDQIQQKPKLGVPEYGMLSLATGEEQWLSLFRQHLLEEAKQAKFTGPANSVKWSQYQAAQRVYFYMRISETYPDLFTIDEQFQFTSWFKAINKRALTAEWVDWLYAVALSKFPEGPYENQENGAGLLSLLTLSGLEDPTLIDANKTYLEHKERGWDARFRNTDDVYAYQMEWLENAYYQSLLKESDNEINRQLSFEWMLMQALPDGAPLVYNYPFDISSSSTAFFGANLLQDPEMIWWAGQTLAYSARVEYVYPRPVPGVEVPMKMEGTSPVTGSCLIYGDTGLPNQSEGIAPDKIVFRDGWERDSRYMLLNLRFTGWHRYKATNTIPLLYQDGPLIQEVQEGYNFIWLPEGRSKVRDKRIQRENLNGLQIYNSGINRVVTSLTGVGSRYAQDPPHFAEVITFETNDDHDITHTRLVDWQGWTHDRWIDFRHNGEPILVADSAVGSNKQTASLTWHPADIPSGAESRYMLRTNAYPVEMLIFTEQTDAEIKDVSSIQTVLYAPDDPGYLRALTLFLFGDWVGAQVERLPTQLRVFTKTQSVTFELPEEMIGKE